MSAAITDLLKSGQLARLIPTVADSKKEERATSTLLASFMVVPAYAREVLANAGAPAGKRLKVVCYTEITFNDDTTPDLRPDGLIIVSNGPTTWTALVEAKIGNKDLTPEQIENYLDLAKKHGINALITISNQFATTPTHHPVKVNKNKLKAVELYHFSWLSLKSKAVLLTANKEVDDPEQAYILSEIVRYMEHDSSGISSLTQMPGKWKDLCHAIQQKDTPTKSSDTVLDSVAGWHQLLRHMALKLGMSISQPVKIALTRSREKDAELNFSEDCSQVTTDNTLTAHFEIPNTAAKLVLEADFQRKTINFSMRLDAPKDRTRATASINWLTRQLKGQENNNLLIRAYWPKRSKQTSATLAEATDNPKILVPEGTSTLPTALEVTRVIDLAGRFKGSKTFVEETTREFAGFYEDAGQHLSKWVAQAPKIKEKPPEEPSIPTIFTGANDLITDSASQETTE